MITSYIGIGSNMGERKKHLLRAVSVLKQKNGIEVSKLSSLYNTSYIGPTKQEDFLNAVIEVKTSKDVFSFFRILSEIELELGRKRKIKWGARTIDLDILLFGRQVIMDRILTIPHPEMVRRKFVLVPLMEINPKAYHPIADKEISAIWSNSRQEIKKQRVELFEERDWYV